MVKRGTLCLVCGLVLILAASPLFAQSAGKIFGHKVTVLSNAPNFQVLVDEKPYQGNVVTVPEGKHRFRVRAPGFVDWVGVVDVKDDMSLNAQLQQAMRLVPLTIIPNVNGAAIFVDGAPVPQNTVPVPLGMHTVTVIAPGYQDYNSTVNVGGPLTIQATLVPALYALTVQPSVGGALIFVDGVQVAGNVVNVTPGTHALRVVAPGFQEFNTSVTVSGPVTVNAPLTSLGFPLTVQVNVDGAQVSFDGAPVDGTMAYVRPGRHAVRVSAEGYQDFNATVNVTGPLVINAQLNPAGYLLTVTANVQGAVVAVNGAPKGPVPYAESLPPGAYAVTVSAPGFSDFAATVSLAQPVTVNAQLMPAMATLSIVVPPKFLNKARKDGGPLKLSVDGREVPFRADAPSIQLTAGRHRIVLMAGPLLVPLGDFDFAGGVGYSVELFMELRAKPAGK